MHHLPVKVLFFVSATALFTTSAFAASFKVIEVEWDFHGEATAFHLYHDGELLCRQDDPTLRVMRCEALLDDQPARFTMTAVHDGGESPHSAPYTLRPPPVDDYGNHTPTAAITATPSSGDAPLFVTVDGSSSFDLDGNILAWSWDFGDGTFSEEVASEHIYFDPGNYTITLTVIDNFGASNTISAPISVQRDPPPDFPW